MKCPLDEAIAAHAQAVFVDEADAKEYCTFKNTTTPAQPEQEPVAWPCEIEEADFEKDTITLKMLTSQYVVRAGKHWLSTTPPAQPAQRQPLKQERIDKIIERCQITLLNYCSREKQTEFARAVEATHGITGENT